MRAISILIVYLILPALAGPQPQPHWPMFRKHLIDTGANECAAVADVNQDGRLDIIAGENWFEAPDWRKHRMREIPFFEGYIDDLSNFALDVNADGYPDVIASSWYSEKLAWYENPRRHDGGDDPLWKEHIIEKGFNPESTIVLRFAQPEQQRTHVVAGRTYRALWRGDTVLTIEPPGAPYPIFQREGLRATRAPMTERATGYRIPAIRW